LYICLDHTSRASDNEAFQYSLPEEMLLGLHQIVDFVYELYMKSSEIQVPLGIIEFTPIVKAVSAKAYVKTPIPKAYFGLVVDIVKTDATKVGLNRIDSFEMTNGALVTISTIVEQVDGWWLNFNASTITKEYKMCQWCTISMFRAIRDFSESRPVQWAMLAYYKSYAESRKDKSGISPIELLESANRGESTVYGTYTTAMKQSHKKFLSKIGKHKADETMKIKFNFILTPMKDKVVPNTRTVSDNQDLENFAATDVG
jgi:hypothetical protein